MMNLLYLRVIKQRMRQINLYQLSYKLISINISVSIIFVIIKNILCVSPFYLCMFVFNRNNAKIYSAIFPQILFFYFLMLFYEDDSERENQIFVKFQHLTSIERIPQKRDYLCCIG